MDVRSLPLEESPGAETRVLPTTINRSNKAKVILFFYTEMEELARGVAKGSDTIELQAIKWGQFESGFPNLFIPNAYGIRGQHVAFLAAFSSPEVIFEQLSIIYALPRMGGPTNMVIYDIHALQERFYFGDHVLPCFESGIPLLKHRIAQLEDSDKVTIAFPDDGARKRFGKQLQHYPVVVCTKIRDGDKRVVSLLEGSPEGRHVIIVDDLVNTGGTLIECQKLLRRKGAAQVSAFCTHGVFPQKSWERFGHETKADSDAGFAHFWMSDSCPRTVAAVRGKKPFEILSLADSIRESLHI